ncbi:unnamed protein product, partial [marine sediment metagenome]
MTDLILRNETLPDTIEDLNKWRLIAYEALKAQNAKLRAIDNMSDSKDARDAVLADTKNLGMRLIMAERKMGELLSPENRPSQVRPSQGGSSNPLPPGITHKTS